MIILLLIAITHAENFKATQVIIVLKINLEKCRCIIGGPLSREFYTYGDVVVCRNFLMDVEKYLIEAPRTL